MILTRRSPLASTLEPKDIFTYAQAHNWPGVLIADTTPFSLFECWKLSKKTGVPAALGRQIGDVCIYSDTDEGLVRLLNATEDDADSFIIVKDFEEFAYRDESDANACAGLRATALGCLMEEIELFARPLTEFEFTPRVIDILERSSSVDFCTGNIYFPSFSSNDPDLLYKKALEGLKARYGALTPEIKERARYEYDIIVDKGFSGYFLIVSDYVLWSKRNGIRVGPGRGSGAGSIIAYALGITELDPLLHKLLFERFLNPERPSVPDFDIDFDDIRRHEAIDYVTEKYGKDSVAQIITNGTMKAKAALHDAARVLDHPLAIGARLSTMMPVAIFGREMPLGSCFDETHERYEEASRLREEYASDETSREIIDLAMGMEGATRQWGVHAAGVIICGKPLAEVIAMANDTTGFDYPTCESLGAIKFDFLGLRNLTVITDSLKAIKARHDVDIDIDNLPLDDLKTYQMLSSGDAIGVFQLEASGLRNLLRLLKPTKFEDLSAVVALYRPGPMGVDAHTSYARRANGNEEVQYPHPELEEPLEDILGDTYGLIVYQEQVMSIAQRVAGYSLGSADILRKALGKKSREVLDAEYPKFKQGMLDNGYSQDCIDTLWDILIPFASYSFNRAHSASYGLIAYQTAYLKAHYPVEYMSALMTSVDAKHNKLALYLAECRNMGITVLSPDINDANGEFYAVDDSIIRFGLKAIRSVGDGVVRILTTEREENGFYDSLEDLFFRAHKRGITKAAWQNLILAGGLDEFGTRKELLDSLDMNLKIAADRLTASAAGFDDLLSDISVQLPNSSEYPKDHLLKMEKHVLGLYITGHPLDSLWPIVRHTNPVLIGELSKEHDNRKVRTFAGIITKIFKKTDKDGKPWGIVTLEDPSAETETLVFSNAWPQFAPFAKTEELIVLTGFVNYKDETPAVYANSIFLPNKPEWEKVEITLDEEQRTRATIEFIKDELTTLPGPASATIFMPVGDSRSAIIIDSILITTEAIQNLSAELGSENVVVYTA